MKTFPADIISKAIRGNYTLGDDSLLLLDSAYSLVADESAAAYFRDIAAQTQTIIGEWVENIRDCDKFSRVVATIAMLSHMKQAGAHTGIALGVFAYFKDGTGGHAINFMVTKIANQPRLRIRFFEPQTGEELTLTTKERAQIMWALL